VNKHCLVSRVRDGTTLLFMATVCTYHLIATLTVCVVGRFQNTPLCISRIDLTSCQRKSTLLSYIPLCQTQSHTLTLLSEASQQADSHSTYSTMSSQRQPRISSNYVSVTRPVNLVSSSPMPVPNSTDVSKDSCYREETLQEETGLEESQSMEKSSRTRHSR
jgi:hypothetical protein